MKARFRRLAWVLLAPCLLLACSRPAPSEPGPATADAGALVARGQYLTTAADCVACHTAPGGRAFAGGRAFRLPFGTMYSTNITPDEATGIGGYTDDQFVRALMQGIRRDGKHLYPSMPYTSFTAMSRADALAIKAYLFSLPPIRAPARPSGFGFPFNQRWSMAFWDAVFLEDHRFQTDPALTPEQNRGAYLATALGHCGECHTPRNIAFAMSGCQFCGADLQGWRAFNVTADRGAGIGGWTRESLVQYLSTGHADGHGAASGPMAEAVANSLQYLTPPDAQALAAYLAVVKARPGKPNAAADPTPLKLQASVPWSPGAQTAGLGQHIFESSCASCHAWNGGAPATDFAALAGSRAVSDPDGLNVVQVILAGADTRIAGERVKMPAFAQGLSDAEIAAVSNYVLDQFGGVRGTVTARKVRAARGAIATQGAERTRQEGPISYIRGHNT